MSVEGMWKFQSGSVDAPDQLKWGGIVILETERVFGGDSMMAYKGTYEVSGDTIKARVRSWVWNTDVDSDEVSNVFFMEGNIDHIAHLTGTIGDGEVNGVLSSEAAPGIELRARLEKIADLP